MQQIPQRCYHLKCLPLGSERNIPFDAEVDLDFRFSEVLPYQANGLVFRAFSESGNILHKGTCYSIGGGFVLKEGEQHRPVETQAVLPYSVNSGKQLVGYCDDSDKRICDIVFANEQHRRTPGEIEEGLWNIWTCMRDCMYRRCHTDGVLPGGLDVNRWVAWFRCPASNAIPWVQ